MFSQLEEKKLRLKIIILKNLSSGVIRVMTRGVLKALDLFIETELYQFRKYRNQCLRVKNTPPNPPNF